jgi:hypothetical protein
MKIKFALILSLFVLFFPATSFATAFTNNCKISVNSVTAPADGYTSVNIDVLVRDQQGNNLAGDKVTLTSSYDPGLTINDSSAGTNVYTGYADSNGTARFVVKSSHAGDDTFKAVDSSDSPATPVGANDASVKVTFTSSSVCRDTAPRSIPRLTSAVSNRAGEVTLIWVKAADPVSRYVLAYGTTSKNYIYGNQNIGPQGTTTYTVGGLNTGTTYYFAVQAVNGCTSGNLSNELSTIASGSNFVPSSTPTQTPSPTIPLPTKSTIPTTVPTLITKKSTNPLDELMVLPTKASGFVASSQRVVKKSKSNMIVFAAVVSAVFLIILESVAISYWKKSRKKEGIRNKKQEISDKKQVIGDK